MSKVTKYEREHDERVHEPHSFQTLQYIAALPKIYQYIQFEIIL